MNVNTVNRVHVHCAHVYLWRFCRRCSAMLLKAVGEKSFFTAFLIIFLMIRLAVCAYIFCSVNPGLIEMKWRMNAYYLMWWQYGQRHHHCRMIRWPCLAHCCNNWSKWLCLGLLKWNFACSQEQQNYVTIVEMEMARQSAAHAYCCQCKEIAWFSHPCVTVLRELL